MNTPERTHSPTNPILSLDASDAVLLRVKAVPGAKRDAIAGPLGDRLKVRIAQVAEDGRANRAICALVARALNARESQVTLHSGARSPEKVLRIQGVSPATIRQALGIA
ncbi:MAG: DUF167 domain-containing protein [Phycisphaeraceae bacterium]|nr:DUF167 domain-containing protein [Phycisphaeraceae bacterium]